MPSRCAEAVKLSRLGHNRERAGREVHPLSGVTGTQRNVRRHVRCIRRMGALTGLATVLGRKRFRKEESNLTNGRDNTGLRFQLGQHEWTRRRPKQPSRATAEATSHSQSKQSESQETRSGERQDSSKTDHAAHRLVRPSVASAPVGVLFLQKLCLDQSRHILLTGSCFGESKNSSGQRKRYARETPQPYDRETSEKRTRSVMATLLFCGFNLARQIICEKRVSQQSRRLDTETRWRSLSIYEPHGAMYHQAS